MSFSQVHIFAYDLTRILSKLRSDKIAFANDDFGSLKGSTLKKKTQITLDIIL